MKNWGKGIIKSFFFFYKNLIEVTVTRRIPGIYVILGLARPVKYLEYIPQNKNKNLLKGVIFRLDKYGK